MEGWIDTVMGPTGFLLGAMLGVIRYGLFRSSVICDMIPADYVVNAILTVAKETECR